MNIDDMTVRDYFAARALQYLLDSEEFSVKDCCAVLGITSADYRWAEHHQKFCARMAYKYADAMMVERAARESNRALVKRGANRIEMELLTRGKP